MGIPILSITVEENEKGYTAATLLGSGRKEIPTNRALQVLATAYASVISLAESCGDDVEKMGGISKAEFMMEVTLRALTLCDKARTFK